MNLMKEPNPVPGRPVSSGFLSLRSDFHEALTTFGRRCCLLAAGSQTTCMRVQLDHSGVLRLPALWAIGERGYAMIAEPDDADRRIAPLDTSQPPLSPGEHSVYACLTTFREPCGPLEEYPAASGEHPPRGQVSCTRRIVLAIDGARADHLDWIKIAMVERTIRGGVATTTLLRYHPPVIDMRAYLNPRNPLILLADRALGALHENGANGNGAAREMLQVELTILRNIAESSSPESAFIQAQRCLGLLRGAHLDGLTLDGSLEHFPFSNESYGEFLARIEDTVEGQVLSNPFPIVLEMDGKTYMKTGGEFREEDKLWVWRPADGLTASQIALYLPGAHIGLVPPLTYGLGRNEIDHPAPVVRSSSGPGVAVLFPEAHDRIDALYVTPTTNARLKLFDQLLRDGHGLYYR